MDAWDAWLYGYMAQFEWKFEWQSVRGTCRSGGAFNLGRRHYGNLESHSLRNSWKTICLSTHSVRKGLRPSRVDLNGVMIDS